MQAGSRYRTSHPSLRSMAKSERWQEDIPDLQRVTTTDKDHHGKLALLQGHQDIGLWVNTLPDRSLNVQSCLPASQRYPWRSCTLTHMQRQGKLGWGIPAPATFQFCPLPNSTWNWDAQRWLLCNSWPQPSTRLPLITTKEWACRAGKNSCSLKKRIRYPMVVYID